MQENTAPPAIDPAETAGPVAKRVAAAEAKGIEPSPDDKAATKAKNELAELANLPKDDDTVDLPVLDTKQSHPHGKK